MALGKGDLFRVGAGSYQNFHNAFIFGLKGRNGLGQGVCHFVQIQNRIFPFQNGTGVLVNLLPQGIQALHHLRVGNLLVLYGIPGFLEVFPGFVQQLERIGVTRRGLQGVFGDLLGHYAHFRGPGNVLLGLVRGGGGKQEVDQCQNDKNGKARVKCNIERIAAAAAAAARTPPQFFEKCSRIELHSLAPGLAFTLLMYPKVRASQLAGTSYLHEARVLCQPGQAEHGPVLPVAPIGPADIIRHAGITDRQ